MRAAALATAITLLVAAPAAHAANTRVSIANFAWSKPRVEINLDEKVTWDWLGPDLSHSVTGTSANARGLDSDPRTDAPYHRPGYSFTLQFTQPGTYAFLCKLHPSVRGEVVVSEVPGDPNGDPGPQPPLNVDVKRPTLAGVSLRKLRTRGRRGTPATARISERGTLEAEYYRLLPGHRRHYDGYATWKAAAGINRFALGAAGEHFDGRPGRYLAILRATDRSNNVSKPVRRRFAILATP